MKVLEKLRFSEFTEMNDREMKLTFGGSNSSGGNSSGCSGSNELPLSDGTDWSCYCVLASGGTTSWGCCGRGEDYCASRGNSVCAPGTIRCFASS